MTGGAVPTATPEELVDILRAEVRRLRDALRDRDTELVRLRAELADADRTVQKWAGIAIGAQGEFDQLRAHQSLPLSRLVVGVAACAVTTVVGVAGGVRERWRRRG